ncbi:serine/threonine protein kinase [Paenibacillus roseipurpureus]|uniref:non-specific serine/threonine protein kinase n=1 Tax=Paenibacillus roseopurpureus TaxID=2918901 RepID=A0AA96RI06_9BACL|nr:serine/threonine-protein kinase [Paenibacillus sp. MBLB1832]WNR42260.1 serine/threonine-protein kinase [Paenibacillus sp. MBLB1832]
MNQRSPWNNVIIGNRYQLISLLGQGGMSRVYLAKDRKLIGKRWAVKEVDCSLSDSASFMEEAEMLAKLGHAQLPQLVDYFITEQGKGYLVMDYIEGPTLQDLFEKKARHLTVDLIVHIALQLLDIFHYLHTFQPRPIIYRDLKPANVMLNTHNQVRLIDFGVARQFKQGQASDTMQMGTVGFAAPEQYVGGQTDARTDLYTLGSMLYYLLSGGQYAYLNVKPLEQLRDGIPEQLRSTVNLLLQESPQHRCQTALEVKQRLQLLDPHPLFHDISTSRQSSHTASSHVSDQLIIIGGLFAGVGSTFTAISLARIFHALSIPHALVEQPTIEPDLYMLLYGDQHAPSSYSFLSEHMHDPSQAITPTWKNGFTTWVPIPPDGYQGSWQTADAFKLLHLVKKPIVLWDISTDWEHPAVQELCYRADRILVVVDASPGKCNRPSSRRHLEQLMSYQNRGQNVHVIVNGTVPSQFKKEWHEAWPSAPLCTIPELPRSEVLQANWKGDCIQDRPPYLHAIFKAFYPILGEIVPNELLMKWGKPYKKSLLNWFNRHV